MPAPIQAANSRIATYSKDALDLKKNAEHTSIAKMFGAYIDADHIPNWLLLKKEQQLKVKDLPENQGLKKKLVNHSKMMPIDSPW